MNNNNTYILIIIFVAFLIYQNNEKKNNGGGDNIFTKITVFFKKVVNKINGLNDTKKSEPVTIIKDVDIKPVTGTHVKKDYISPNPENTTEYRFVDENMKTPWSTVNVSQHPKYYTSDMESEKIDLSEFFDGNKFYHDNTSAKATTTLPERCKVDSNNQIFCDYNNRLQLVPPKLITDSETNKLLNSIGPVTSDIYKTIDSVLVDDISGNNYQIWEYEDEKMINGGKYFNNVYGSSETNENNMLIENINPKFSF